MADRDKINWAFGESRQNGDIRVAAQAKHMFDLPPLKEINDMFRDGFSVQFTAVHYATSCP